MARFHNLFDFAGKIFAYAWQIGELFARSHHLRGALRQILDRLSRGAIGSHAKRVGPLDLE
jgi:hypothetical protein